MQTEAVLYFIASLHSFSISVQVAVGASKV